VAVVVHQAKTSDQRGPTGGYRSHGTREMHRLRRGRVHPPRRYRGLRVCPLFRRPWSLRGHEA